MFIPLTHSLFFLSAFIDSARADEGGDTPAPFRVGLGVGVSAPLGGASMLSATVSGSVRGQIKNILAVEPRFAFTSGAASISGESDDGADNTETISSDSSQSAYSFGASIRPRITGKGTRVVAIVGADYISAVSASTLIDTFSDADGNKTKWTTDSSADVGATVVSVGIGIDRHIAPKVSVSADLTADVLTFAHQTSTSKTEDDQDSPASSEDSDADITAYGFVPAIRLSIHFWP